MAHELNEQQHLAAYSDERTILCLAGAGAGKTATLLARIERLVRQGIDPKSILSLTFTNAAAFEMKERYKKIPNLDLSKGSPEFRTFHSFCYSLIIKDFDVRQRIGYSTIPELCDDNQLKEIKTRVKLQLGCKLPQDLLDGDIPLNRADEDERSLYKKALAKAIKKENVITFDIMCYNVCALFERDEDCVQKYKQKYTYINVDEFQDSDPRQFRFLCSFPKTTNFYFCADALQNIYQFRNCTNDFVKQLSVTPGWQVIKLPKNYRSTRQICEYANKFSRYAPDNYRIEMEGQRDGEPVKTVYGAWSSYTQPVSEDHLKILIEKLEENKRESAILCRTNKECACVRAALNEAGVEFSSSNKATDTLHYLESALDNNYMLGWLSSMLDTKEYGDYIRLSSIENNPDIHWFLSKYGEHNKIKPAVNKIIKIRNITAKNDPLEDKFNKIVKLLKIKTKCEYSSELITNRQVVESIRDQFTEQEDCKIYVGTIHSSKGLEYDTVYVMGVDDKMFQLGSEDMNNLFYVAMTRAKNHLTIFRR